MIKNAKINKIKIKTIIKKPKWRKVKTMCKDQKTNMMLTLTI